MDMEAAPKECSAAELFDILYPKKCVSSSASQPDLLSHNVTQQLRQGPRLRPSITLCDCDENRTDSQWLAAQFDEMDFRIESKGPARPAAEPVIKMPLPVCAKVVKSHVVPMSARELRQRDYMDKLMSRHYEKEERRRTTAAQLQKSGLLDLEPMRSAIQRLGKAATVFKPGTSFAGTYERALNCEIMSPTLLDIFLRQSFDLALTPAELGCVAKYMDANGDGGVVATEFLREFWKFGVVEHMRVKEERNREQVRAEQLDAGLQATWLARFSGTNPTAMSDTYTLEDLAAAEETLANAAAKFDGDNYHARVVREIFNGPPLTATELSDIIQRNWSVRLMPAQIAAIMATYDVERNGVVDGNEFYRFFTALGSRERARRARVAANENSRRRKKADEALRRQRERYGSQTEAHVEWPETIMLKAAARAQTAPAQLRPLQTPPAS